MKSAQNVANEYFKAFACPSCGSHKLLPTKERIIICQSCLHGYKLNGDVPDFRMENAISFKKRLVNQRSGVNAVITVMLGPDKNQSFHVKMGHCVVVGRQTVAQSTQDEDVTMVGRPEEVLGKAKAPSYVPIDMGNQQLIDRYLSRRNDNKQRGQEKDLHKRLLGNFVRDPDFLLSDGSVSRSHAVIYQDDDGVHVLDLVSKNGTFVNGYEVESIKLKDNDAISVGTASLRIRFF